MTIEPTEANPGRDYVSEMNALIAEMTPDEDYVPAVVAQKLLAHLAEKSPDLFVGWCWAVGATLLTEQIRHNSSRERAVSLRHRPASVFAAAAAAAEEADSAGDKEALEVFAAEYVIDKLNTRRRFGDMTKPDCLYAADDYGKRARANRFEEIFLTAVAKKLGSSTVADVYTPDQILAMRSALSEKLQSST